MKDEFKIGDIVKPCLIDFDNAWKGYNGHTEIEYFANLTFLVIEVRDRLISVKELKTNYILNYVGSQYFILDKRLTEEDML